MKISPGSMLSPLEDLMKVITRIALCFLVAFLGSSQAVLVAQVSDHEDNLSACQNGLKSCNRANLTDAESNDIAVSMHRRNLANCGSGEQSCDRAQLTDLETIALDVAAHQTNVSNCLDGIGPCDHLALTIRESRAVAPQRISTISPAVKTPATL